MWKFISNFGALLAIAGVSAANIYAESFKAHVAFGIFVVAIVAVAGRAIWAIRAWQNTNYPRGYVPVSTFIRYTTTDGKNVVHEGFRQIQIKHGCLTKIQHKQYWTGSREPILTSSLQRIGAKSKDPVTAYDVFDIYFARPRYYNETEILHLRSTMDDSDEKSSTHVECFIETPVNLLHFRVELLHCQKPAHGAMVAWFERRKYGATAAPYDALEVVKFDLTSRSFELLKAQPEAGYTYRLRWDRPTVGAQPSKPVKRKKNNLTTAQNHPTDTNAILPIVTVETANSQSVQ